MINSAEQTHIYFQRQALNAEEQENLPSLNPLTAVVSKMMLKKMARNGITYQDLKSEFDSNGRKGIQAYLGVNINGKPRVTTSKKIIDSIVNFLTTSTIKA